MMADKGGPEQLPLFLPPMLTTAGPLPLDDTGWLYETKWDGVRALCAVTGGELRMWSRAKNDLTDQFPEIAPLAQALDGQNVLLDGEVVAFGPHGRPHFGTLQQRLGLRRDAALVRAHTVPVIFVVFDVLHVDGMSIRDRPVEERRERLDDLRLTGGSSWHLSAVHEDGAALSAATSAAGLEGVVAKRLGSAYLPGVRSKAWIKVKHLRSDDFVVGGWVPGSGRRDRGIGSLLIGTPVSDEPGARLRWVGRVGTGFSDQELARLQALLAPLVRPDSPFERSVGERNAVFVEPQHRVRVEYHEFTTDGLLRFPSYKGLVPPPAT